MEPFRATYNICNTNKNLKDNQDSDFIAFAKSVG